MKTEFIRDFQENDRVTSYFLVQGKEVRFKKTSGDPFLALELSDRTGRIEAKMWDGVEPVADSFERDDIVKIKANVQVYRNKPQLVIQKLRKAEPGEYHLGDFIPHTERDVDEMWAELLAAVGEFRNEHLKALVLAFLEDESFATRFKTAPAAKSLHHAFIGGLLEHVCSLLRLAKLVASNYDYIDVDLLRTGVILHDIGKLEELTYDRAFGYSSDGQLLGHITMCLQWIEAKCAALPDFPTRLKRLVEHLVLSHHGKYEFGSPKLPMFPEALALSYIDDLDSKLESMRASLDAELGEWTGYNFSLERPVLNVNRFLAGPEDEPEPSAAPAPPPPLPTETASLFGEKLTAALSDE